MNDSLAPAEFFNVNASYVWPYSTQPDPNLGGLTADLAQGHALGGGSAVNAMGYCRGASSVFDEWAEISGNDGLAWESMFEAFKATTHFADDVHPSDQTPVNTTTSFADGILEVTRQRIQLPFDRAFVDTLGSAFDVPEIDFASGDGIGVTELVETIRADNRTRVSAWNSFGWTAINRPNFVLYHSAWVSKIGFTGTTADCVTYNDTLTNTMKTITASEIIVAAGAIKSPQLLLLSGVGPAADLEALDIPVVLDVPEVGQNLYDHHLTLLVYEAAPEVDTIGKYLNNATFATAATTEYAEDGDGILGIPDGNVFATRRLPDSVFEGLGDYYPSLPADRPHALYEYSTAPFLPQFATYSTIAPFVALVQPEDNGNMTLASADYRDEPLIYGNYWGSEADKAAILYAYKELRDLMASEKLSPYVLQELYPGANVTSDEDLWAAIQSTSTSFHHPLGTVAIGTVLDTQWRVKGLEGLRVVGSAAAPKPPTCHTMASAYGLGYRAAVDIAAADGLSI